jgi:hypothetical protein
MTKKIVVLAVLTLAMTMLMTGVAMAAYVDAGFYTTWYHADGTNAAGSPHSGFAQTSQKCGYCHAVHNAQRSGYTGEVLLRGTVDDACTYCHIDGALATTVDRVVYGGEATNYTTDSRYNHSSAGGANCVGCHTVHSARAVEANLDGNAATVKDYILKADIATMPSVGGDAAGNLVDGTTAVNVLSTYCTQCHAYYETGYDDDATAQHHIMQPGTDLTTYGNTQTAYGIGSNRQVAATGSDTCFTCHDSYALVAGFPHNMTSERFMKVGAYFGDTLDIANDTNGNASEDGACLKCHAWTDTNPGDTGIGIDF